MEDTVNVNAVALVDGQPQTMGLMQMLRVWLEHRLIVVRRRSVFRRQKAEARLHLVEGLLVAILDIDEVIQLIRESDDASTAKDRLMGVFDLSDIQATYILDMPLRRLTRFSRLELEKESDELRREIASLTELLEDEDVLRAVVSDELSAVAQSHATPRRTLLMEASSSPVTAAVPLEVNDEPCVVLLSSTGLLARTPDTTAAGDAAHDQRATHDVVVSAIPAMSRGEFGLVTSAGRVLRLRAIDLPSMPAVSGVPALSAGAPLGAFVDLPAGETALCLTTLDESGGLALATASGTVKRVVPDVLQNKDAWEVIRLDEGDRVVGACRLTEADAEGAELVFITSDAQLLRIPATSVRPQGRSAGGMAGIKLGKGAEVVSFSALVADDDAVVVTVAGSAAALPGTESGTVKITPLGEYPGKGRGTGGVRCHKFRSGEDTLLIAWAGRGPARAATASGVPITLPDLDPRRDATGVPAPAPIGGLAGTL
jgi:DNA gyrase subunit A